MEEDGTKRTRDHALLAGDTFLSIDVVNPVLHHDGSSWAVFHALGHLALAADNQASV